MDGCANNPFMMEYARLQMYGEDEGARHRSGGHGITPAYAGRRKPEVLSQLLNWDHPRVCGEKLVGITPLDDVDGITPAYAGRSTSRRGRR